MIAIVLSMTTRINVGMVSIAMAGSSASSWPASAPTPSFGDSRRPCFDARRRDALVRGGRDERTLRPAQRAVRLARGDARWLPLIFRRRQLVSSVGPGAVERALMAPLAMAVAARWRAIFLTALMKGDQRRQRRQSR